MTMVTVRNILFLIALWTLVVGCAVLKPTYRNPVIDEIGQADPSVIYHNKNYFLYTTGDNWSYDVFRSSDLVHWIKGPKIFQPGKKNVWAPDVFYDNHTSKFYLYYTVGYKIGVAVADKPDGKYLDQGVLIKGAIDAHMFQDEDGSYYLYYVSKPESAIHVQPMVSPLRIKGEPTEILRPTETWEMKKHRVTEAPWILKHKNTYYLLFSGGGADTLDYAIGYATARNPTGPFTKYPGNPILKRGNGVLGPGHGSVIKDRRGTLWLVYHQQTDGSEDWNRFICIDRIWIDAKGVLHGQTTRGTPQPAPKVSGFF